MSKFEDDVREVLHKLVSIVRGDAHELHEDIDNAGKAVETEVPENASE